MREFLLVGTVAVFLVCAPQNGKADDIGAIAGGATGAVVGALLEGQSEL